MYFDNDMMDYLECADANGYDVDDCFNLVSRESSYEIDDERDAFFEKNKEQNYDFTI